MANDGADVLGQKVGRKAASQAVQSLLKGVLCLGKLGIMPSARDDGIAVIKGLGIDGAAQC